ncbi:MAG: hypothetical protein M3O77_01795 [Chloroflexota bacterium]|nr:hypothetical protein [Chloroflexota bacterium]
MGLARGARRARGFVGFPPRSLGIRREPLVRSCLIRFGGTLIADGVGFVALLRRLVGV